jgi:hypothetical protein
MSKMTFSQHWKNELTFKVMYTNFKLFLLYEINKYLFIYLFICIGLLLPSLTLTGQNLDVSFSVSLHCWIFPLISSMLFCLKKIL